MRLSPELSGSGTHKAPACDERQVEHRQQPGIRLAHGRDRVQAPHGGGREAAGVVVAVLAFEVELAVEGRIAFDVDAVATLTREPWPLGCHLLVDARDVLEHHAGLAADHPLY